MARGHPVKIGDIQFSKKGDALAHLRDILNSYSLNERVSDEHAKFLLSALANHPEYVDKIGVGIDSFEVRSADYGTRCFWIVRTDGSTERFSYKSCV